MSQHQVDLQHMARALHLAAQGMGRVEPNPMVGCVVVTEGQTVGEGWHRQYGAAHAEVEALAAAKERASGATLYVTLEPCCHQGKTPPCTQAILDAGVKRVLIALGDPFAQAGGDQVEGGGIAQLQKAGIEIEMGMLEDKARELNAPYLKLIEQKRPWILGKWAMSLDGKIATHTGQSRWISGEASRRVTHQLRGRVDAIVVGMNTAAIDDPQLTARPPGERTASRIVVDSLASLSTESRLVRTAREVPVIVAVGPDAPEEKKQQLTKDGCEVFCCDGTTHAARLEQLLEELGRRRMTNVLVEGGGQLLGSFLDAGQIDEVHVFIGPQILGGAQASTPIAGTGIEQISSALQIRQPIVECLESDVYIHGRVERT